MDSPAANLHVENSSEVESRDDANNDGESSASLQDISVTSMPSHLPQLKLDKVCVLKFFSEVF